MVFAGCLRPEANAFARCKNPCILSALLVLSLCALPYALCLQIRIPQSAIRNRAVSRKIREEFENGRDYYALDDRPLRKPNNELAFPSAEKLRHHYENEFRG